VHQNVPTSDVTASRSSRAKRFMREPLLHFLVAGLALFVAYQALHPNPKQPGDGKRIVITDDDLRQLQIAWRAQWQRFPTPDEMRGLVNGRIREEILYREALALGLEKGDTIVKRRLAQKMEFLADDVSALREPRIDELKAWLGKNRERFALPILISFHHVYFSPDRRGSHARDDAVAGLQKLASGAVNGQDTSTELGDPFMFQDYYAERSRDQVANIFGTDFAKALFAIQSGSWQGPIESGLGWHLVLIDAIVPGRVPAFDDIAADVKVQWTDEQRVEMRNRMFELMKARYEIVFPAGVVDGSSEPNAVSLKAPP
jgi:peptidyl-prolyl cis-trans isomerase C